MRMEIKFRCIPILLMKTTMQRLPDIREMQHICIFLKQLMGIRLLGLEELHLKEIEV